jgi:hypothetical protein
MAVIYDRFSIKPFDTSSDKLSPRTDATISEDFNESTALLISF